MKVESITDVGLVREQNEDDVRTGLLEDGAWAIVCDGMGGANAGEVASQNGVQVLQDCICHNYVTGASEEALCRLLEAAMRDANTVIYNLSEEYPQLSGMGTTAVAVIVTKGKAVVCHVGDSRAYRIQEDSILPLTKDHSMVQQLVDAGTLTQEEAKVHPKRNLITRCLGVRPEVVADSGVYDVEPGDVILLCSDGLTGYVEDAEILHEAQQADPEALMARLVALAKERGGSDNITVAIVEN